MSRYRKVRWPFVAVLLIMATVIPALAAAGAGFMTPEAPYITLDPGLPAGSSVTAIISSGESVGGVTFEGIPDGIGLAPGPTAGTVDVYVTHEQSTVPFFGRADFEDASITTWTLDTATAEVLGGSVAIPASDGYLRFCSAFMAGPAEGFSTYTFFTGEETNDIVDVPAGAPYGPDPALDPQRQGGFAVILDTETGEYRDVPGMGRHNHENTVVVPGGWNQIAMLSGDDTFNAPSSQLYLYLANNEKQLWNDNGSLWAFRVTHTNDGRVKRNNPFNNANDYLDIQPGDDWQGQFIRVPKRIARGVTGDAPQAALEEWSNEHNVFQFIRLEDLAYDRNEPRVVYVADTGASRVVPDPTTGRLLRGPSGTVGQADNGRIYKFVMNKKNPRMVDSFSVYADGDAPGSSVYVPFTSPDNIETSANSLMVQEDTDNAAVWWYEFSGGTWSVAATVNDPDGESSGIVDASEWFGPGAWLLDVQGHGTYVDEELIDGVLYKRESGQLMLMVIPGS